MSIEQQIAAAWKRQIDTDGIDWASDSECFSRGYLAAMKDLYVDLDLNMSECCDFEWYWILTDDGWHHAMRVDFGFDIVSPGGDDLLLSCGQEAVRRVIEARLPSPSDLFTEIKFN